MPTTEKVLGQSNPAATTLTDFYTVPALTRSTNSTITVCNRSATLTTFRVSVAIGGAADTLAQYIFYDLEVAGNDTFAATIGMTLGPADVVRVYATLATLSFNLFGIEITA
jgi:hypothetical protein